MMIKKFSSKAYAFMLWGAWIGFADMPKTFTNVLYQNDVINSLIDGKLEDIQKKTYKVDGRPRLSGYRRPSERTWCQNNQSGVI
jgi:hypothetical protein